MVTNNSANVGNETDGTLYQGKGGAAPDFTTTTYPTTTTINEVLYSSAANTVVGFPTSANKIFTTTGASLPELTKTYAEGTWTPELKFGGGTTGITYGTQAGTYVQFAEVMVLSFMIILTSKGSDNGVATIYGLPITVGASGAAMANCIPDFDLTLDGGYDIPFMRPVASATYVTLHQSGSGNSPIALDDTNFANTTQIAGMFLYTDQ